MEIVHIACGDYDRYEELLLQRDQLEKEAHSYQQAYTCELGDLIVEVFQLKIDCIALKKSIAFCVAARNRGEDIDDSLLQKHLEKCMEAYRYRLDEMIRERDAAQRGKPISFYELGEIKKVYRRLAKQLHPDISNLTEKYPELDKLFRRVMTAYRCNDLKELQELEILINKVLKDNGIESTNVVIPDVLERIEELENEIQEILTTEPYLYKELLADEFRLQSKKDELVKEKENYQTYKNQLELQLNEIRGIK